MFWGPFGETFGSILGSKSRSNFRVIFGMRFCSLSCLWRGFGAASTRLRRGLTRVPGRRIPPGRRPFRARRDPITSFTLQGSLTRDLTRSGPEALRISSTYVGMVLWAAFEEHFDGYLVAAHLLATEMIVAATWGFLTVAKFISFEES